MKIWEEIETTMEDYQSLNLHQEIDYDKFYLYSIIAHSTAIEGSSLTELDTQLLLDYGISAEGKPLVHHLMNTDLKKAYDYIIEQAKLKKPITIDMIKTVNGLIMQTTGSVISVMAGNFDSSKGDFRLCSVRAGVDGNSYMDYLKVPQKTEELCDNLSVKIKEVKSLEDIYTLSFDAHLDLVTIHPFADGNGRTSRLLMNYIQFYHNVVPTKILKEKKAEYIKSLMEYQNNGNREPFISFMANQLLSMLKSEIEKHK